MSWSEWQLHASEFVHCIACLKQGSCLHTLGMHACSRLHLVFVMLHFGLVTFWACDMKAAWRGLLARRTAQERRKDIAAAKIAATWRMYQQRKAFVMHTR